MIRTKLLLLLSLVILVGFAVGWLMWLWLSQAPISDSGLVPGDVAQPTKQESREGYCCLSPGSACQQVTDPGLCFRAGGKGFNVVSRNCDYYCMNVKP